MELLVVAMMISSFIISIVVVLMRRYKRGMWAEYKSKNTGLIVIGISLLFNLYILWRNQDRTIRITKEELNNWGEITTPPDSAFRNDLNYIEYKDGSGYVIEFELWINDQKK